MKKYGLVFPAFLLCFLFIGGPVLAKINPFPYIEQFSDVKSGWEVGTGKGWRTFYARNGYEISLSRKDLIHAVDAPVQVPESYVVETKARLNSGNGAYGLAFHVTAETGYLFIVSPSSQNYMVLEAKPDNQWEVLKDKSASHDIKNGSNALRVAVDANEARLYINAHFLTKVPVHAGNESMGLGLVAFSYGNNVLVHFESFSATNLIDSDRETLPEAPVTLIDFSQKDQGFSESVNFKIQDGVLRFNGGRDEKTWLNLFSREVSQNCTVAVKAKWTGGAEDTAFGLVFRHQSVDDFYYFKITRDGYYTLIKSVEEGWEDLAAWQETDLIKDDFNTLKVICRGSSIRCYLNEELVVDIQDEPSIGEQVSVGIAADSGVKCNFDDFSVQNDTAGDASLDINTVHKVDFTGKDQGFSESAIFKIQDGVLRFNGGRDEKTWLNLFSPEVPLDCTVAVKAKWTGGDEDTAFGLVFRHQSVDDFYYFKISRDGYYKLIKSVEAGWEDLTAWQETDLIGADFITLKVICRGSSIQCYLNEELVVDIEDEPAAGERVSVGVAADSGVKCSFDDFSVVYEAQDAIAI